MKTLLALVALAVALASSGCWWRAYPGGGHGHEQRSEERGDREGHGDHHGGGDHDHDGERH